MTHAQQPLKLTRHRVGDQSYELRLPSGEAVANVSKTGSHLDNYPWSMYPLEGWYSTRHTSGAFESLKVVIDWVSWNVARKAPVEPAYQLPDWDTPTQPIRVVEAGPHAGMRVQLVTEKEESQPAPYRGAAQIILDLSIRVQELEGALREIRTITRQDRKYGLKSIEDIAQRALKETT